MYVFNPADIRLLYGHMYSKKLAAENFAHLKLYDQSLLFCLWLNSHYIFRPYGRSCTQFSVLKNRVCTRPLLQEKYSTEVHIRPCIFLYTYLNDIIDNV